MKNHGNQPKTMKNHETTLKNHGNQPKTMKNHETTLKTMETNQKPWKIQYYFFAKSDLDLSIIFQIILLPNLLCFIQS